MTSVSRQPRSVPAPGAAPPPGDGAMLTSAPSPPGKTPLTRSRNQASTETLTTTRAAMIHRLRLGRLRSAMIDPLLRWPNAEGQARVSRTGSMRPSCPSFVEKAPFGEAVRPEVAISSPGALVATCFNLPGNPRVPDRRCPRPARRTDGRCRWARACHLARHACLCAASSRAGFGDDRSAASGRFRPAGIFLIWSVMKARRRCSGS